MLKTIEYTDLPQENARFETKYLSSIQNIRPIIDWMESNFAAITYKGFRQQNYHNRYFDTPNFKNYFDHHQGAFPREKLRVRTYINSEGENSFLEQKRKYANGISEKLRKPITTMGSSIYQEDYSEVLTIEYQRLQFWNEQSSERITIDTELTFTNKDSSDSNGSWSNLAIIELKSPHRSKTKATTYLKELSLRPEPFSKYCIANAMLRPELKRTNFNRTIKKLNLWAV